MLRLKCITRGAFVRDIHPTTAVSGKDGQAPARSQVCASRWSLKLARCRLWNEAIDTNDANGVNQQQDLRHLSPEFNTFIGMPTRSMRPGQADYHMNAFQMLKKRLPNHTHLEIAAKRDIPMNVNARFGKRLHDETVYGIEPSYPQKMYKQMQKAARNDRKISGNKFRVITTQGGKNPPAGFTPIAEAADDDE